MTEEDLQQILTTIKEPSKSIDLSIYEIQQVNFSYSSKMDKIAENISSDILELILDEMAQSGIWILLLTKG